MKPLLAPNIEKNIEGENDANTAPPIFYLSIPLQFFRKRLLMTIILGNNESRQPDPNIITTFCNTIMLVSFFIFRFATTLAGIIFIFYIVKISVGLDLFPNIHLFELFQ